MFSITGITGNVGGNVAYHLLAAGRPIRAVVRDGRKGDAWAERGCEVAIADITDAAALASAFKGAEGVFVLVPPNFDPALGFPEAQEIAATLKSALEKARPGRVVYLSTIGAQASERNLLTQHTIIEQTLSELPMPITFLRPAWFMENYSWDVVPARDLGNARVKCQALLDDPNLHLIGPATAPARVNYLKTTDGASVSKAIHNDSQLYPTQFDKTAYTG